jgi:hypothetical protein
MKTVYWHRELPPLDAEAMGEHTVEAESGRVKASFAHHDDVWRGCYNDLMERTRIRLEQEIARLGGQFAHVVDEAIAPHSDDANGTAWLHGRFNYVLYGRPGGRAKTAPLPGDSSRI